MQNDNHKKTVFQKMLGPVCAVIAVNIGVLLYISPFAFLMPVQQVIIMWVILGVIDIVFIYMLYKRYQEIKGGEEDDLGNY